MLRFRNLKPNHSALNLGKLVLKQKKTRDTLYQTPFPLATAAVSFAVAASGLGIEQVVEQILIFLLVLFAHLSLPLT